MGGAHHNSYCRFTNFKPPDSMQRFDFIHPVFPFCLLNNGTDLLFGHRFIAIIKKLFDHAPTLMISNHTDKRRLGTTGEIGFILKKTNERNGFAYDEHYPPPTGGISASTS